MEPVDYDAHGGIIRTSMFPPSVGAVQFGPGGSSSPRMTGSATRAAMVTQGLSLKPLRAQKPVYLCGPIAGLSYEETNAYYKSIEALLPSWITPVSPMRGRKNLVGVKEFSATCDSELYQSSPLSTQKGIFRRDYHDVMKCDVILANFIGARRVSIGSMFELAWAWDHKIPLIVLMEKKGNVHEHGFVLEAADFLVETPEQAVEILTTIVTPGL